MKLSFQDRLRHDSKYVTGQLHGRMLEGARELDEIEKFLTDEASLNSKPIPPYKIRPNRGKKGKDNVQH